MYTVVLPTWLENYEWLLFALGVSSLGLFLGSVIVIPLVIAFLPEDYFIRTSKPLRELSVLHLLGRCLKNVFGFLFLLAGLTMLFIPGQGILTLVLGLSLIDFPGKRRWEVRLLQTARIRKMIEWCRRKTGRPPLRFPNR